MKTYKKILIGIISVILIAVISISGYFFFNKKREAVSNEPYSNTVRLIFTTDEGYKEYLRVALKSAIMNKDKDSFYDIRVFSVDLSEEDMKIYKDMSTPTVKITPIAMQISSLDGIGDFPVFNHVSRADMFKFFFPELLKDWDKAVYIDADTLIMKDLRDLYNTNLEGKYIGAVKKYSPEKRYINLLDIAWIPKWEYSYNCGIMVYDLKKMRKDNITKKLVDAKNKDEVRYLMTQDAFNKALPVRNIKIISPVYNVIARWMDEDFEKYKFKKIYEPYLDNINSMAELRSNAVIIHFAGIRKPWNSIDIAFTREWRDYAHLVDSSWVFYPEIDSF